MNLQSYHDDQSANLGAQSQEREGHRAKSGCGEFGGSYWRYRTL